MNLVDSDAVGESERQLKSRELLLLRPLRRRHLHLADRHDSSFPSRIEHLRSDVMSVHLIHLHNILSLSSLFSTHNKSRAIAQSLVRVDVSEQHHNRSFLKSCARRIRFLVKTLRRRR